MSNFWKIHKKIEEKTSHFLHLIQQNIFGIQAARSSLPRIYLNYVIIYVIVTSIGYIPGTRYITGWKTVFITCYYLFTINLFKPENIYSFSYSSYESAKLKRSLTVGSTNEVLYKQMTKRGKSRYLYFYTFYKWKCPFYLRPGRGGTV